MTLMIELDSETEKMLLEGASAKGVDVQGFAEQILKVAVASHVPPKPSRTPEQIRAWLDEMSLSSPDLSHLRDETFPRSMIYNDHD